MARNTADLSAAVRETHQGLQRHVETLADSLPALEGPMRAAAAKPHTVGPASDIFVQPTFDFDKAGKALRGLAGTVRVSRPTLLSEVGGNREGQSFLYKRILTSRKRGPPGAAASGDRFRQSRISSGAAYSGAPLHHQSPGSGETLRQERLTWQTR
jgi:hypothetical protein